MEGALRLKVIDKRMDSNKYIELIDNHFVPSANSLFAKDFILLQDNAPCHRSKQTMAHLREEEIEVFPWPAISPDLNVIENVWGLLVRRVHEDCRQFDTIEELKNKIFEEWNKLDQNYLKNLVHSMPNRLADVLISKGDTINY